MPAQFRHAVDIASALPGVEESTSYGTPVLTVKGRRRGLVVVGALLLGACARHAAISGPAGAPPALVVGAFRDDYGSRHVVSASEWRHGTKNVYRIVKWNAAAQYAIARNDSTNAGEKGRYTRIDWMPLAMAPYTWAFCFTAYDAPSVEAAERTPPATRDTPRTGCGGYPFSRMAPADAPPR